VFNINASDLKELLELFELYNNEKSKENGILLKFSLLKCSRKINITKLKSRRHPDKGG